MAPIARLYAEVAADTSKFEHAMNGVDNRLRSTGSAFGALGGVMTATFKVAAVVGVAAFGALTVAIAKSVDIAADMQAAAAGIAAIFGEAAPPIERVRDLMNELAMNPQLAVGANEAAEAIKMLAQNGATWEEVAGGMPKKRSCLPMPPVPILLLRRRWRPMLSQYST